MSPLVQVRHVLAKDLRQWRWWFVAMLVLGGLAVATTLLLPAATGTLAQFTALAMLPTTALAIAVVVQGDAPTSATGFWTTRPLHPWSVLGAKLAVLALVLVLAIAVQGSVARHFGVRGGPLVVLLAGSVRVNLLWMLVAALLAALFEDLRSFALAAILLPVGVVMVSLVAAGIRWTTGATPSAAVDVPSAGQLGMLPSLLAIAALLSLLGVLYRTRSRRWPARAAGLTLAGLALGLAAAGTRVAEASAVSVATAGPPPVLSLDTADIRVNYSNVPIQLTLSAAPDGVPRQLALQQGRVSIVLRDGSRIEAPVLPAGITGGRFGWTQPPTMRGIRWLGDTARGRSPSVLLTLQLTSAQRRAMARGVTSLTLDGSVAEWVPRVIATLPLRNGAEAMARGRKLRIEESSAASARSVLTLLEQRLTGQGLENVPYAFGVDRRTQCALVNSARSEGVLLQQVGSEGGSQFIVLPGLGISVSRLSYGSASEDAALVAQSRRGTLTASASGRAVGALDEATGETWRAGARVLLFEPQQGATFPVHLTLNLN